MRVLVTGGAGFLGSHLVDRLLAGGDDVTVVDDLSSGSLHHLDAARRVNLHRRGALTVHRADLTDPGFDDVVRAAAPEVVHHLADGPGRGMVGTVAAAVAVASAAAAAGARRFVYAGSGSVYGRPARLPASERAGLDPRTPAGAGVAAVEPYLRAFRTSTGLDWTVLALADVYGPRQRTGMVPATAAALLAGSAATGADEGSRDLVYVQDAVDAFLLAGTGAAAGRRLNIGGGAAIDAREVRRLLADALGVPIPPGPAPTGADGDDGDDGRSPWLEIRAARQLGWVPRTPPAEGLAATAGWLRGLTGV